MRILNFIVDKQQLKKDKLCDFSRIVPGTRGYLEARFHFGEEWDGCAKAAVFYKFGEAYPAPVIDGRCVIPPEALTWKLFQVQMIGERDGYRICTNRLEVKQDG